MKESTRNLINNQIKKVLAELEQVKDIKDRVELRIEAIEMIYKVSGNSNIEDIAPQGKDSIKEDKAKEPVMVEEEVEEQVVEEEEEFEEVSIEEVIKAGANLDPEVAAQAASVVEGEEVENLEEEPAVEEVEEEVVEEEQKVSVEVPEEIVEEFNMLSNINNVNDEIVEHKIFVANWIHEDDLETVELYINYFASNIEEDENGDAMYIGEELHVDFLNDNNIAGFIDYINVLSE